MSLEVSSDVSKDHYILSVSLSHACGPEVSSQLHACLPAAPTAVMMVMDSPSGTVKPNKPFILLVALVVVFYYSYRKATKIPPTHYQDERKYISHLSVMLT